MGENPKNYNLLVEQWIPVLWTDGKPGRVGIREALTQAGRIRQIAATNPMDRVAILRFLLALLYWCKGSPPDTTKASSGDPFPADWFSKLNDNKDCFNLLGDGKRFYQDRDARRPRPATDLIQEIPTGNNFWHFRHSTDKKDGLCPACCALGLLRLPLFSVSGLPDLRSGINGVPPVYLLPWGMSLLDTLCASWVTRVQLGDPAWLQPTIRPTPNQVVPLLTGLTLLSRRVWLHEPSSPPGMCNGCGAKQHALIRTCEFKTAGKQENDLWDDPHVVYLDKTPRKAARAPDLTAAGKFRMDRPWPNLFAHVVETRKFGPGEKPTSLLVVGFATDQAKNIDVWERTIAVPPGTSIHNMAASLLRQWREKGSLLEKRIGRSEVEGAATIAAIRPHVEGRVSAKAGELIAGTDQAWQRAAQEYRPMMEVIAKSVSPGFTSEAVRRRQQIASVAPDMRPKTDTAEKSDRKKGGHR
jgi:CRISPR type I-E-associated protein CasA/Cse1